MFKKQIAALLLAVMMIALPLTGCSKGNKKEITIGSKNFTENEILAEMMAQDIENNSDIQVNRKINMGGTLVCFQALKKGQIDIYPEYTGTGLLEELKLPVKNDPEEVYKIVKSKFESMYHITWLKQLGFNNTYALAMPENIAKKNNINTISDLIPLANKYTFGAEQEFFNREDGYTAMIKTYGLNFGNVSKMDISLKYQAVNQGKVQVTDAFATDGQLKALNMKILKDDKKFFPPYYAAPIVRDSVLEQYPQVKSILNKLGGLIDDETMQELNYKADNQKKSIQDVASDFLKKNNLIK